MSILAATASQCSTNSRDIPLADVAGENTFENVVVVVHRAR
jgi:hypothetical protein